MSARTEVLSRPNDTITRREIIEWRMGDPVVPPAAPRPFSGTLTSWHPIGVNYLMTDVRILSASPITASAVNTISIDLISDALVTLSSGFIGTPVAANVAFPLVIDLNRNFIRAGTRLGITLVFAGVPTIGPGFSVILDGFACPTPS